MAEPLTDEELDVIERGWQNHAGSPGPIGATVLQLIAELRTARVEIQTWQARCSADQDNMTRFRRRAIAAEAERDDLQARIEATLQLLATKFIWCYERQVILIDKVRAALTGRA